MCRLFRLELHVSWGHEPEGHCPVMRIYNQARHQVIVANNYWLGEEVDAMHLLLAGALCDLQMPAELRLFQPSSGVFDCRVGILLRVEVHTYTYTTCARKVLGLHPHASLTLNIKRHIPIL